VTFEVTTRFSVKL